MIGTIDIKVQAASPNIPLAKLRAIVGSPSNLRVRNVPREIGKWEITQVFVSANYPDNTSRSVECVQTAGIWVATLPASSVAGISTNGYTVTANGKDENGAAVTGYILGKGDVEIINADGTITPGETTYYVHLLTAAPTTPHKGDAYVDAGSWMVYDGTQWVALGGIAAAGQYVQAPTAQGGDGKWHRVIIADGALAYDDEGVNEPPESASKVWVGQQVAAEATARGTAITQAVAAEASSRSAADTAEATARREADEGEAAARAAAVSAEATARQNADTALGGRIDAEASSRSAADTALGGRIDAEATSRSAADAANASAITALQLQTAGTSSSGLKSAIESETARAEGAESELNDAIVAETSRAATAEAQSVHKYGNEAIGGVKSFAASPEVPTLPVGDDSIKAANTAWVILRLAAWWAAVKAAAHTISGVWTFSSSPVVPKAGTNDNSNNAASTAWVVAKLAAWWSSICASAITITGRITASGGITGNLTGNVTGNVTGTASGNLPLGGGTITGIIRRGASLNWTIGGSNTTTQTKIFGGTNEQDGGYISLSGENQEIEPGFFKLIARANGAQHFLIGKPNGTLSWDNNDIVRCNVLPHNNAIASVAFPSAESSASSSGFAVIENGQRFVAPLSGWLSIACVMSEGSRLSLQGAAYFSMYSPANNSTIGMTVPILKGQSVTLAMTGTVTQTFRNTFYAANGENY